ncbi:hypothetical protein ACFLYI_00545 [Chloroflexota bacterium]
MTKGQKIQQILGIIFCCLFYYMIIDKGHFVISSLIQNNPDDFWGALLEYIIRRLSSQVIHSYLSQAGMRRDQQVLKY